MMIPEIYPPPERSAYPFSRWQAKELQRRVERDILEVLPIYLDSINRKRIREYVLGKESDE